MKRRVTKDSPGGRAFTLIELLVVIIIIVILVGIIAGVGAGLTRDSRGQLTRDLLTTLDRIVVEYEAVTGNLPSYVVEQDIPTSYNGYPGPDNTVETYGSGNNNRHARRPDASVFLRQAKGVGVVDDIVKSIPARFLVPTITSGDPDPTPSIVDAWAKKDWPNESAPNPYPVEGQALVYYIHPDNKLANQLYGRCINKRPYFLSAGPDGRYGTTADFTPATNVTDSTFYDDAIKALDDNITSYVPGPINETMGGDR